MCPEAFCGDGSDEKRTSRDRNGRRSGGLGERICRALEERRTTPASGGSGVGREAHGDLQGEPENLRNPTATDCFGAAGHSVRQGSASRACSAALDCIRCRRGDFAHAPPKAIRACPQRRTSWPKCPRPIGPIKSGSQTSPPSKRRKVGSIWRESWICIHAKWRGGTPPTRWPRSL